MATNYDDATKEAIAQSVETLNERLSREPNLPMSERIRILFRGGTPKGEIARQLNIRYQWVRNVLVSSKLI